MKTVYLPEGSVLVSDLLDATAAQAPDLRGVVRDLNDDTIPPVPFSNREHARVDHLLHFARMCQAGELLPRSALRLTPCHDFTPSDAARCSVSWVDAQAFCAALLLDLQPMPVEAVPVESSADRQARRLQACRDARLNMPAAAEGRMPNGIARMAEAEGVTRQAFTADVRAALKREAKGAGSTVRRAK